MSDMIKLVAKALTEAFESEARVFDDGQAEILARAALEAMRDPPTEMLKVAAATWDDDWCTETNALHMWDAMIDAALLR